MGQAEETQKELARLATENPTIAFLIMELVRILIKLIKSITKT